VGQGLNLRELVALREKFGRLSCREHTSRLAPPLDVDYGLVQTVGRAGREMSIRGGCRAHLRELEALGEKLAENIVQTK
jgi:hypothetical protein